MASTTGFLRRVWNGLGLGLFGLAVLAFAGYSAYNYWRSPALKRTEARTTCRTAYVQAHDKADSLLADAIIVNFGSSKTTTRNETCAELRVRGEL